MDLSLTPIFVENQHMMNIKYRGKLYSNIIICSIESEWHTKIHKDIERLRN